MEHEVHCRIYNKHFATCSNPEPEKPTSYFLKIQINIILPSTSRSSTCSLSPRCTHQSRVWNSPVPMHATWTTHLIWSPRKMFGEWWKSGSSLCSLLQSPSPRPSYVQISPSGSCSQTSSACVRSSVRGISFHQFQEICYITNSFP